MNYKYNIPVNIIENDSEYVLEFIVPKYKKENFTIEIEDNKITVSYKSDIKQSEETNPKYLLNSYQVIDFVKKYKLPKDVNIETFNALFDQGILKIKLPKSDKKSSLQIKIK
ncbi:Hsp20/alpha crystallin family protein [Flammeovirga pacifica]|uniref:SHSP domain-containing protein n=1 Tax=Flammeovirga pacifica TaxID=915059 RepID=A0A1S1Z1D7_FLAPC|nr:Hsp20/alpha crystallin family protein [Flammeovirga pacifica]OHX67047.1 hypothetical protein NH26_12175 [Flammeovirga pacifica]